MTLSPVLKIREWLTLDEAVQCLSPAAEGLTEADVLRLALAGHLQLWVYLPEGTVADCWDLPEDWWDQPDETASHYWMDVEQPANADSKRIGGTVWKLPMVPPSTGYIESRENELRGLPPKQVRRTVGVLVESLGDDYPEGCRYFRVRPEDGDAFSALPIGSKLVVSTASIFEFVSGLNKVATATAVDPLTKPLLENERIPLLVIIGALAAEPHQKIDINHPSTAAKQIEKLTIDFGARISARAIENHLKKVPEARERRSKET